MLEQVIVDNLIHNEVFCRKVIPYIQPEFFSTPTEKQLFTLTHGFVEKYNKLPNRNVLGLILNRMTGLDEQEYNLLISRLEEMSEDREDNVEWLVDQTESWCQERAMYNAIVDSMAILQGDDKNRDRGAIPEMMREALAVSFDSNIGHDYFEDAETRYNSYIDEGGERIAFDIELLNKITKGGFTKKTINVLMAETGVGKSLVMCHMAANNIRDGKNVLYITMEMEEVRIGERIDANLMKLAIDELPLLSREQYLRRVSTIRDKYAGNLKIKEYPTGGAGAAHFRHLINEYKLKEQFFPDIIYIDYINICSSSKIRLGQSINTNTYVKAITEELRALAVEMDVVVVSATQFNRDGMSNSDPDLTDISESIGLTYTADFILALVTNEELEKLGQILAKQLKNRYAPKDVYRRFLIGIDRSKMTLYDIEDSAQKNVTGSNIPAASPKLGEMLARTAAKRDFSSIKHEEEV